MTIDKHILIRNIYCMLSYAFRVLKKDEYHKVDAEEFDHAADLLAAILENGVSRQIKQGLYREYVSRQEMLKTVRGRIQLNDTIRSMIRLRQEITCEYNELSVDNLYNRILKLTLKTLLTDRNVKQERRDKLKKLLVYFDSVALISAADIRWDTLHYGRCNESYEMLMNICYLVLTNLVQNTDDGKHRLLGFTDDNLAHLYEKFILAYYQCEHPELHAESARVDWNLTEKCEPEMIRFLPAMQTDICLKKDGKTLIIDAKYYSRTLLEHYDKLALRSGHIYQIFAYVKNHDTENSGNVSGLLLYAKTDEEIAPDCSFTIGGNVIGAKTLDLNMQFPEIKKQLDDIACRHFKSTM